MNEAIKSIIYIAVISGILTMFSSCSKNKKHLNYVISLVIILAFVYPFKSLFYTLESGDFEYQKSILETTPTYNQTISIAIKEDLVQKFKLKQDAITVTSEITNKTDIDNLTIEINDSEYFRYAERFKLYAQSQYGCNAEIIQNFGEQ